MNPLHRSLHCLPEFVDLQLQFLHGYRGEEYSIEQLIPGYFNGCIERELVPVRGKRQDVVRSLVAMHAKDQSSATRHGPSRASIANAFTRWAHEVNVDPWLEDDVQRAAGRLISNDQPLPFEPIELG